MGCIHLSYDDFCRLTFIEFEKICKAYNDEADRTFRSSWERMRILAAINIQPYCKSTVSPQKLLKFPWDKEEKKSKLCPKSSKERFEYLVKKFGKKY